MRANQLDLPLLRETVDALDPGDGIDDCPFILPGELPPASAGPARSREQVLEKARWLAQLLSDELSRPVRLSVTDNRSTMLSYRKAAEVLALRVHHMFLDAPEPVVRAIADYAGRGNKRSGELIDAFVRDNRHAIREGISEREPAPLIARGRTWDLQEMFDRLNAAEFSGKIEARIGWGRGAPGKRRRTIRMGVYDHLSRTIRVHPALDRPEVPRFFVEYIVFHEMLHQAIPARATGGRRQHHGPEFRARERLYPDYGRALEWEREHLGLLLGRLPGPRIVG